jgi:TIR domain
MSINLGPAERQLEVFCSYSTDDESHRREFERCLAGMRRAGLVALWNFRKITPGDDLDVEISAALKRADIIVLLVSSSFLSSDYCWNIEMRAAVDRHDRGEARIIPIIVRSCVWSDTPFARLAALPKDAKPVSSWSIADEAWTSVAEGMRDVVTAIQHGRQNIPILEKSSPARPEGANAPYVANVPQRDSAGLLTASGVLQLVLSHSRNFAKPTSDPFLLYENSFQRTWLVLFDNEVVCVVDDVTKGGTYEPVAWRLPFDKATPVQVQAHRKTAGRVDFGTEQTEWLYSVALHPDPLKLQQELGELLS